MIFDVFLCELSVVNDGVVRSSEDFLCGVVCFLCVFLESVVDSESVEEFGSKCGWRVNEVILLEFCKERKDGVGSMRDEWVFGIIVLGRVRDEKLVILNEVK